MADSFSGWMFTSNATDYVCPGFLFGRFLWPCPPPNACATEKTSGKQYCCAAGSVCWNPRTACASDGSTFECKVDGSSWCCLKDREVCTQIAGQINICYSTAHDLLNDISVDSLNGTFSSLSSAAPSASSYTFNPSRLLAETQASSGKALPTEFARPDPNSGTSGSSASTLSGGAIAGIVIGVVAAIVLACLATFFLTRRLIKPGQGGTAAPKVTPFSYEHQAGGQGYVQELPVGTVGELPGTRQYYSPRELPAQVVHSPP